MNNQDKFQKQKDEITAEILKRYKGETTFWENFQVKQCVGKVLAVAEREGAHDIDLYASIANYAEQIHDEVCKLTLDEDTIKTKQLAGRVLGICCSAIHQPI